MTSKTIWFGIPTVRMQNVPAPLAGAQSTNVSHVEQMQFYNGGTDVERSLAYHKEYEFEFNAPLAGSEGLGVFNKYASGFYGTGLIYFADPYTFETNVFPAAWASPGLVERGWPAISAFHSSYVATASNTVLQPPRSAVFTITDSTVPDMPYRCVVPIPPDYTLYVGVSGSSTGAGVVRARPINPDGSYATTSNLTLLSPTGSTRLNTTFAGSSFAAVEFYVTRSSAAAATVTIASMMARLYPTGFSPVLTGQHVPGDGHTGLVFADDARVETYQYIDPPRKALTTRLVEVGAWRA